MFITVLTCKTSQFDLLQKFIIIKEQLNLAAYIPLS